MDSVTIDGVEYVKASTLAKQLKYTADYIGQLCRGRKVDAHLVGRTWYVYPPSLLGHKNTRYAELRSDEKTIHKATVAQGTVREVRPPTSKKTIRSQVPHFHNRIFWKSPAYETDAAELLPSVTKQAFREVMPIKLADSEKVRVSAVSKNVTMMSQPLPAVALSGTLKVQDFEPRFELDSVEEIVEKPSYIEPSVPEPAVVPEMAIHQVPLRKETASAAKPESQRSADPEPTMPVAKPRYEKRVQHSAATSPVAALKLPKVPQPTATSEELVSPLFSLVVVPVIVLVAVGIATALLLVESVTTVAVGGNEDASLRLNASLIESFLGNE